MARKAAQQGSETLHLFPLRRFLCGWGRGDIDHLKDSKEKQHEDELVWSVASAVHRKLPAERSPCRERWSSSVLHPQILGPQNTS